LRRKRRKVDFADEAGERIVGRADREKLLLSRGAPDTSEEIIGRWRKALLMARALP
jgi:hypothetical protein